MWVHDVGTWSALDAARQPAGFLPPDTVVSWAVRGPDEVVRQAWLVVPGGMTGPVPVVLCPHPFGFTATGNLFGEPAGPRTLAGVPGIAAVSSRKGFATLTVAAEGARLSGVSLGWAANLEAYVAALELAIQAGVPLDLDRVVATGLSMGGQEAILLACRYPHLIRAVAVQNAVTDVGAWHRHLVSSDFGADHAAAIRHELAADGLPSDRDWSERSPSAQLTAAHGMRLQIRLNDLDSVVPAAEQGAAYAAALRRSGTDVEVVEDVPSVLDVHDPGRSAHEHVSWDAMLDWLGTSLV